MGWFGTSPPVVQWLDHRPLRHDASRKVQAAVVEKELSDRRASGERDVAEQQREAALTGDTEERDTEGRPIGGAAGDQKCAGDQSLERLYATLAEIDAADYPRSHHQRQFHDSFIKAALRSIYTDDYAICEKRLEARFNTDYINPIVMVVTPRRFGKTYSVAQFVAAYTAAVHGKEVAIFSTGRRASKKMLDLVVKFLMPLIDGKKRIYTRNVEEVVVQQLVPPYAKNKVCSYPAKVQVRLNTGGICSGGIVIREGSFFCADTHHRCR